MSHNMHAWNPYSVQSFSFSVQYTPVSSTIFFWPSIALPPTRFNNKFYTSHSTAYRKSAARGRHTPPPSSPPTNRPTVRRSEGCIVENPCLPLATRSLWTDGWWRRNFNNHSYYVLHFLGYCHPPSATHNCPLIASSRFSRQRKQKKVPTCRDGYGIHKPHHLFIIQHIQSIT